MKGSGKDSLKPPGAKRLAAGLGGGRPGRVWTSAAAGRSTMIENIMDQESGRWHDARREGRFPRFATRRFSSTTQESGFERGRFLAIAPDLVQAVGRAWTCGDAPEGEGRSCGRIPAPVCACASGRAVRLVLRGQERGQRHLLDLVLQLLQLVEVLGPRRAGWPRGCRAWRSPARCRPARWPRCTS